MKFGSTSLAMMLAVLVSLAPGATAEGLTHTDVFVAGESGYDTYRIPAVVATQDGALLAFAEARKESKSDTGHIDLVCKRSTDQGQTWSSMITVVTDPGYTNGNPAPVVDRRTGRVWLLMTYNPSTAHEPKILTGEDPPRTVWITHSDDHGQTWATPRDISAQTRKPDWRWYATGPCHGTQLEDGTLVIPSNHSLSPDKKDWHSHVIYSEDGETWHIGGIHDGETNESTVVELADGRLYQNMRCYRGNHRRAVAYSEDQGKTWGPAKDDPELIEPVCQASAIRYTTAADSGKNRVLFSNPASKKREQMTVRLSYDETETWPVARELYSGPSAYSDLVFSRIRPSVASTSAARRILTRRLRLRAFP